MLLLPVSLHAQSHDSIHLKHAVFDPTSRVPPVPPALRADADTGLWIVQFGGRPTDAMRSTVRVAGAQLHGYLPENAYVARMTTGVAARIREMRDVRWVGSYHPAYRLEPFLVAEQSHGSVAERRYNIVVVDKRTDKPALVAKIAAAGGRVDHRHAGSILLEATLSGEQLLRVARMDEVLWIDRWTPTEHDMDNARVQGGGNYVESVGGYTGQGINGHVYEGIEAGHQDFTNGGINVLSCGSADQHGHCTAGIIFGNGTSHPGARGMAPDAQPFYTTHSCVTSGASRWQVVEALVGQHEVMFTSASWGNAQTTQYTSISADTDDIIFDHDIPWTQSQSNTGNQFSRPEAWAKNVFSIGAVDHFNNSDPLDDSWASGNASTGPAADGRIKPDLCAYYDFIHCSDLTGAAGYTPGNSNPNFTGTSGATPIVAGHNALAIQMFTDGVFGNPMRVPGGTRFENRPHFTTLKALQVANARQYAFTESSTDNRREHQGWGFPSLQSMWDNRGAHVIVDETDVLSQGNGTRWSVSVAAGQPELKVSMTWAEPAGNPASSLARINDLTLRAISPSGIVYWGNHGLEQGNESTAGGFADSINTVENVFVRNPEPGTWRIDVAAQLVAQDSHAETPEVDADYALVVNGAVLAAQTPIAIGSFGTYGSGCPGSVPVPVAKHCPEMNTGSPLLTGAFLLAGNGFALEVIAEGDLIVTGFEIRSGSRSAGTATLQTALYGDDGSAAPGKVLATGTMTVGPATQWYATSFGAPVALGSGDRFFLFFRPNANITAPLVLSGTNVNYFLTGGSGVFTGPFQGQWSYRATCETLPAGSTLTPTLTGTGMPSLGSSFRVSLALAAPRAPAAFLIGASNTRWLLGGLPFSLAPIGAPGCSVLASSEFLIGGMTDALGELGVSLRVPDVPTVLSAQTFHQFWVLDPPANPLGLAVSNGGSATIGQ